MTIHNLALVTAIAGCAGALVLLIATKRRSALTHNDAMQRLTRAEQRACDAAADTERADAVAAMLWLHIAPDIAPIYRHAVKIFGKQAVDRTMRETVECGEWKLPERGN
jgi:hypothetical protein